MKLFENYLHGIEDIVTSSHASKRGLTLEQKLPNYFEKGMPNEVPMYNTSNANNKVLIDFNGQQLIQLFGDNPSAFSEISIGPHPDFSNLGFWDFEKHYCVTMFADIKGSTHLNEKYSLPQVRKIKDTILTLAIHVALGFGGHIHRLQGDGIVIQFVRRSLKEQDAVINSLNTSAVLTQFISTDLAEIFSSNGVKPLRIRTGIDLGYKDDVIWSHYGIPGCTELTTTSLHTDLASKLQARANPNGILVRGNVKEILDIKTEFCKNVVQENGEADYYVFRGYKDYRMFEFDWKTYLKTFDFVKLDTSGKSLEIEVPSLRIQCTLTEEKDSIEAVYYQNSRAIPKNWRIKYALFENGRPYHKKGFESIIWTAHNSGKEAEEANQLEHDFGGNYKDQTICETLAAYKGHHYVECKIDREHLVNKRIMFPIFVE